MRAGGCGCDTYTRWANTYTRWRAPYTRCCDAYTRWRQACQADQAYQAGRAQRPRLMAGRWALCYLGGATPRRRDRPGGEWPGEMDVRAVRHPISHLLSPPPHVVGGGALAPALGRPRGVARARHCLPFCPFHPPFVKFVDLIFVAKTVTCDSYPHRVPLPPWVFTPDAPMVAIDRFFGRFPVKKSVRVSEKNGL